MTATLKNMFVLPFKNLDMYELFGKALEKHEEALFDLNRQQLDRGKDALGNSLGRYANFKYKGRFEPVDLLLTGEFRRKFTLQIGKKSAEIFSQDSRDEMLKKRYGKDIEGIPKTFQPNLAELVKPTLGELIKDKLGL